MAFGDYNYTLEVYNQANSSKLCTFLRGDLLSGEVVQELCGEESLTFQIPRNHSYYSYLQLFRVVRLCDTDKGTYTVYRIKSIKQWRQRQKVFAEIYCEHLKYDLSGRIIPIEKHFVQENPQTILDYILGFSDSFTRGDCPGTQRIDFDISYESCMETIKRLAETLGLEWEVEAGASPSYKVVNLATLGGDQVDISYGVNLVSLKIETSISSDFATRFVPVGGAGLLDQRKIDSAFSALLAPGPMNVGGAAFIVSDFNYSTYWLQVTSTQMLSADDALNNYYAYLDGETIRIIDSVKSANGDMIRLESSPPGGVSVGERVIIWQTENNPSIYVPNLNIEGTSAYLRTERVFHSDDLPDVLNAAGPAGYSDLSGAYTSGLCQGWEKIGSPTVSQNTNTSYLRTGTSSQKVVAGDGEGIKRNVYCGSALVASFYIWIYISALDTGTKLKTRLKVGDTDYFPANADTGEDEAYITTTGWRQIIVEGAVFSGSSTSHYLEVLTDGGGATFYLDSVMVQLSEYITDEDVFYPWDSRVTLWEQAAAELADASQPSKDYDIEIIDLYEADRDTYSAYEITPGTYLEITDAGLGLSTEEVRTRRKSWNLIRPWECRLEVTG